MIYSTEIDKSVYSLTYCLNKLNNEVTNIDEWNITINAGGIDYGVYFNFDVNNKVLEICNQPSGKEEMYIDDIIVIINETYSEE